LCNKHNQLADFDLSKGEEILVQEHKEAMKNSKKSLIYGMLPSNPTDAEVDEFVAALKAAAKEPKPVTAKLKLNMDNDLLKQALHDLPIPAMRFFDTIESTNDTALEWASHGAADNSLVIADLQTKGRGRFDRLWITEPGSSLAFSVIFQPTPKELSTLELFSPLAALAVCQALKDHYQFQAQIKWPNDVLANGKKTVGILVEVAWLNEKPQGVIVGVGINIAPVSVPPADQLRFPATCVEDAVGQKVDRFEFLAQVLKAMFYWRAQLGTKDFLNNWDKNLAYRQEWVRVDQPEQKPILGQVQGINPDGSLRLMGQNHETFSVNVGELQLRPLDETPGR
jgi:BirA family transcriptional regulator, biotin operon repressor / biotin---[acetyl-CoA-carboxylase] ligase